MPTLEDALNDSLNRLENGATLQDCLQAYPEYADELLDLLAIQEVLVQARPDESERLAMRGRLDEQMNALIDTTDFDAPSPFQRWSPVSLLVATLVLAFVSILLLNARTEWLVTNTATPTHTATPLATNTPIITQTIMPSATHTPTATVSATATATATLTQTATASATHPPTEVTPETQSTATLIITSTNEPATPLPCTLPDGWVVYRVQVGDNLSIIANNTGTTVEELTTVNCIDNPRLLAIGDELFVPRPVTITPQASTSTGNDGTSGSTNASTGTGNDGTSGSTNASTSTGNDGSTSGNNNPPTSTGGGDSSDDNDDDDDDEGSGDDSDDDDDD